MCVHGFKHKYKHTHVHAHIKPVSDIYITYMVSDNIVVIFICSNFIKND